MFKIKDAWQIVEEVSTEGTWTDVRDGQVYPYKQIGNQIWMTANLNYGGKQGDWVPNTTDQSAGHAWRYRDEQNYNSFPFERGALYRFTSLDWAVPDGWHIPTVDEFDTLFAYLDSEYGNHVASAKMNTNYWAQGVSGTNDSGLTLIPTGMLQQGTWSYCDRTPSNPGGTNMGVYWTATDSGSARRITNVASSIYYGNSTKTDKSAYAIRLIKNSGVYVPQPAISTITTTLDSTGSDNKLATEKATRSAITSAVSSKMSNPMTAAGDLIVGNASGVPEALSAGAEGKVLKITSGVPAWGDDIGFANPMTNFGDIIFGGQVFSGTATPLRLGSGTIGQVLGLEAISTFGMKPKWVDFPGTCQENFNICLSTKKENLTSNPNKLYAAKFISHETATRTKLGFYHCTGIQGCVMMGIYDKLGNLIGQTGPCSFATEPDEEMLWYDVETPFTVTAGEEYWFVFWGGTAQGEYNMSLTVLQHDITQNFDPYIVGSCSYTSSKTTLPSTIPSLQYETTMCYMAVK